MLDMVTRPKKAANTGIGRAIPPKSEIMRVWRRSYSIPTNRKSAPVESPWFTIWRMLPFNPMALRLNMPSITKPRWATDEYATSFLMSAWTMATSDP